MSAAPPTHSDFYKTPLGQRTQRILAAHVAEMWPPHPQRHILALGAGSLIMEQENLISGSFSKLAQSDLYGLVDSRSKLFPEASIDRILSLHCPGTAEDSLDFFLQDCWRVLKGEGRLLLLVPRKQSPWAKKQMSPFAQDTAYTAQDLRKTLINQGFVVRRQRSALYLPPCNFFQKSFLFTPQFEKVAAFFFLQQGGGVLMFEAKKRVLGPVGSLAKKEPSPDRIMPLLSPAS